MTTIDGYAEVLSDEPVDPAESLIPEPEIFAERRAQGEQEEEEPKTDHVKHVGDLLKDPKTRKKIATAVIFFLLRRLK